MTNQSRRRPRHLFLPYIPFRVSIYPQGMSVPSYLEKAVIMLIEGRVQSGAPLPIDELIYLLALGEPAGREMINGLWRKGWIILNGREGTVHLSKEMHNRLDSNHELAVEPDWSDLASGEPPTNVDCCFDLITGKPLSVPADRMQNLPSPPFIIEPFYPQSQSAPYGVPMLGFMDLNQKDILDALRSVKSVAQMRRTSETIEIQILPPEHFPTLRDIRFLRLFFHVDRDINDHLSLTSAEDRNPLLGELANAVSRPIEDKILNQTTPTPLQERFLDEEHGRHDPRKSRTSGTSSQLSRASISFGQVETVKSEAVLSAYMSARQVTQKQLEDVQISLAQSASRHVDVQFLPNRSKVKNAFERMLGSFRGQAVLTSPHVNHQEFTNALKQAATNSEANVGRMRRFHFQTAGRIPRARNDALRRTFDREFENIARKTGIDTRFVPLFPDGRDPFVDTSVLIVDVDEVLISLAGLLGPADEPTTGFVLHTFSVETNTSRRVREANVARDMIAGVARSFRGQAPNDRASPMRQAQNTAEPALLGRVQALLDDLAQEAEADPDVAEGFTRELSPIETRDVRRQSKLRQRELEELTEALRRYETQVPVNATGHTDEAIFDAACTVLRMQSPNRPFYVGVKPDEPAHPEFVEVIEDLFGRQNYQEGHLVSLGEPGAVWDTLLSKWGSDFGQKLHVHRPVSEPDARRMGSFMPFVIGTAGCVLASGGITNRIVVATMRPDKTQLGIELKGRDCQKVPLEMLDNLLQANRQDLATVEDLRLSPEEIDIGHHSSTFYRRWRTRMHNLATEARGVHRPMNLGTSVLIDGFRDDARLVESCRKDAHEIDDPSYGRAVEKAAVLAGRECRDAYANLLWRQDRLCEAAILASDQATAPLSDAGLRRLVLTICLPVKPGPLPKIQSNWLQHDTVLAMVALGLLDPSRRHLLEPALPTDIPPGKLGALVTSLRRLAKVSEDAPMTWQGTQAQQLAHSPKRYGEMLRAQLEALQRDRGNTEARKIQELANKTFGPLVAIQTWAGQNPQSGPGDIKAAIDSLRNEYGPDYERHLGSRGKRLSVARTLLEDLDRASRAKEKKLEPIIGARKTGLVMAFARFLELLYSLTRLDPDASGLDRQAELDFVRRDADAWAADVPEGDPVSPIQLLREVALTHGRSAPNGVIDFAIWRFPNVLEALHGAQLEELDAGSLADGLMAEEWPLDFGLAGTFAQLLDDGRFTAAELVLFIEENLTSLAQDADKSETSDRHRDQLSDRVEVEKRKLVDRCRRLELDAAQIGLDDKAKEAREFAELLDQPETTSHDVEYGAMSLSDISNQIAAHVGAAMKASSDSVPDDMSPSVRTLITEPKFAPWSRRLALSHYLKTASRFESQVLKTFAPVGAMRSALAHLQNPNSQTPRQLVNQLNLKNTPVSRGFVEAVHPVLAGAPHLSEDEGQRVVAALDLLFAPDASVTHVPEIEQDADEASAAAVHFPDSGLARWLSWQVPNHTLYVILSEQYDDRSIADMALSGSGLPVFFNPFRVSPRISDPHLMIGIDMVMKALTTSDPSEALKSSVVHKTALSTMVPWGEDVNDADRARHLGRFLEMPPEDVDRRLAPDGLMKGLSALLYRLRMDMSVQPRKNFGPEDDQWLAGVHSLAFLSAGHLTDAFDIIWRCRERRQGSPSLLNANAFMSGYAAEAELVSQIRRSFARWVAIGNNQIPSAGLANAAVIACQDIWLASNRHLRKDDLTDHLANRRLAEPPEIRMIINWMEAEAVVIGDRYGGLAPNPAHPFASIRSF